MIEKEKEVVDKVQVVRAAGGPIMLKESIIRISVEQEAEYTLEMAYEVVDIIDKLRKGNRLPLLVDFTNVYSMSRPIRQYYSSPELSAKVSAVAIVSSSAIGRVVGNFFLGLNKPLVPTRLIASEEEALNWLKRYVD